MSKPKKPSKAQARLLARIRAGKLRLHSSLSGGEWLTWRALLRAGAVRREGNLVFVAE